MLLWIFYRVNVPLSAVIKIDAPDTVLLLNQSEGERPANRIVVKA